MSEPQEPEKYEIVLLRGSEGHWCARHPNNPEILELFGTDTLPLPFSTEVRGEIVRSSIQRLKPNHRVSLEEEPHVPCPRDPFPVLDSIVEEVCS